MAEKISNIDLSYLEGIADGDKDIIKELIEIFLDQMPEFTDGFQESLKDRNWIKIAAIAHKAKSSVITMGMEQLGNVDLKNLELAAKQMRINELKEKDSISDSQEEEILVLEKNFTGYPEDRILWVKENTKVETIRLLIDKFNQVCDQAVTELNNLLSTY